MRIFNYYPYMESYTGYILMEYVDETNIREYIEEYTGFFDPITLDDLFIQLIDGFSYIEENSIIHRDIREGNILITKDGIVKIIDFGIGKVYLKEINEKDSLHTDVNRACSDTLPQEYYEGLYTSQTDIFYLGELFNRLLKESDNPYLDFSYNDILTKMLEKHPSDRYATFTSVKEAIGKHDFTIMEISQEDKDIYQAFSNFVYNTVSCFIDNQEFNHDPEIFITKLEKALNNNLFEDTIQENSDITSAIITGRYRYRRSQEISCSSVENFVKWFRKSTSRSQKLILTNIITKLSSIGIKETNPDIPF